MIIIHLFYVVDPCGNKYILDEPPEVVNCGRVSWRYCCCFEHGSVVGVGVFVVAVLLFFLGLGV